MEAEAAGADPAWGTRGSQVAAHAIQETRLLLCPLEGAARELRIVHTTMISAKTQMFQINPIIVISEGVRANFLALLKYSIASGYVCRPMTYARYLLREQHSTCA